jgi:hypothetical protein
MSSFEQVVSTLPDLPLPFSISLDRSTEDYGTTWKKDTDWEELDAMAPTTDFCKDGHDARGFDGDGTRRT